MIVLGRIDHRRETLDVDRVVGGLHRLGRGGKLDRYALIGIVVFLPVLCRGLASAEDKHETAESKNAHSFLRMMIGGCSDSTSWVRGFVGFSYAVYFCFCLKYRKSGGA